MIVTRLTYAVIVCLLFVISLLVIYFSKERVENDDNKIYTWLIITNFVGLILHLLSDWVSYYYNSLPSALSTFILKTYLLYFLMYGVILLIYLISLLNIKKKKIYNKVLLGVSLIIYITLYFLPQELYADNNNLVFYTYGLDVKFIYVISAVLYASLMVGIAYGFIKLDNVKKKKLIPLIIFIAAGGISILIQRYNPNIVIIDCCESLIVLLMYFTIENPDLNLLRQMEYAKNQADRANRAKSDFLSSMSHEIRTPLNAIVGLSEDTLTYQDRMPQEVIENSKDIVNASQTLLEIVGNILDINKIESNKMEIYENPYNFKEEIANMCKVTQTRIGEKDIKFNLSIADDIPYEVIGDKGKVKEVVNNLLTNAIKYTDQGEINLTIKCINDIPRKTTNIIVTCQDTGKGIKAELINRLFTKFDRLDIERNTTTEGTGLGLAITKSLVGMMGGKINVQSQYGKGSIFMIQIPQKISILTKPMGVDENVHVSIVNYGHKKVLVVDDNKLNIKVARKALADFDFEIDECYDGVECLEKVKVGNEYDLILMDIMMPDMNGDVTMTKLKENPNFNIPTIALTADAVAGAKEKYISEGFVDYIAKPFSRDQIKEKLDNVFK